MYPLIQNYRNKIEDSFLILSLYVLKPSSRVVTVVYPQSPVMEQLYTLQPVSQETI